MEGRTNRGNGPAVPLTGMDLLWYHATQIVLFDLELLERLEWPTMAISDLSFACICLLAVANEDMIDEIVLKM